MAEDWGFDSTLTFNESTQDYSCVISFNGQKYSLLNDSLVNISKFYNNFYANVLFALDSDAFQVCT